MKSRTLIMKKTGSLLLILSLAGLLLTACDKQGPMGPEGPPGPDGENVGGGDGGSFTSYLTDTDTDIEWEESDGWDGYVLCGLKVGDKDYIALPDSAKTQIDQGGAVLVYVQIKDAWHALPMKEIFHNPQGNYEFYADYIVAEGRLFIACRILSDVETDINEFQVNRVKIIVAPASKTNQLAL
jgi:hypothetical protein